MHVVYHTCECTGAIRQLETQLHRKELEMRQLKSQLRMNKTTTPSPQKPTQHQGHTQSKNDRSAVPPPIVPPPRLEETQDSWTPQSSLQHNMPVTQSSMAPQQQVRSDFIHAK